MGTADRPLVTTEALQYSQRPFILTVRMNKSVQPAQWGGRATAFFCLHSDKRGGRTLLNQITGANQHIHSGIVYNGGHRNE